MPSNTITTATHRLSEPGSCGFCARSERRSRECSTVPSTSASRPITISADRELARADQHLPLSLTASSSWKNL